MMIGITGGTGCGKTTLLNLIADCGGLILDCDAIYHQLLTRDDRLLQTIEARFPGTVENGQLQRKKLGNIVFSDENALSRSVRGRDLFIQAFFQALQSCARHTFLLFHDVLNHTANIPPVLQVRYIPSRFRGSNGHPKSCPADPR